MRRGFLPKTARRKTRVESSVFFFTAAFVLGCVGGYFFCRAFGASQEIKEYLMEYAKALSREGSEVHLVPILRQGAGHDEDGGEYPSAGSIRRMIQEGRRAEALAAMHAARAPLYAAACDARVENDGPFESVAEAIKERFYEILDH